MGVSRDTFNRYKDAVESDGVEALLEKSRRKPNRKNRIDAAVEQSIIDIAVEQPAHGQVRASNELRKRRSRRWRSASRNAKPAARSETHHPGYLGSQDVYYVGTLQGVGRIYQQTFVDTYAKVAAAKLYTTKTAITSADLLNDRVLPMFQDHELPLLRILTDRGTEFCGRPEQHDYQLYLATNDIDHTKTNAKSPQTNGIC